MNRILFVDDEPKVLEALRRQFQAHRAGWHMEFAQNGEEALATLSKASYDVMVTDIRMPAMDGSELLEKVRQQYPQVIRMVLSGQAAPDVALKAAAIAHQSFPKPCDARVIEAAIDRVCGLRGLIPAEPITRLISRLDGIASQAATHAKVTSALSDAHMSLDEIAELIEQDLAVASKVLQLANSPLLGCDRPVVRLKQAVTNLGMPPLQALMSSTQLTKFRKQPADYSVEALHRRGRLCAHIARELVDDRPGLKDNAFTAGLLHDVGKLILVGYLGDMFSKALATAAREKKPVVDAERELIGVTHAEIGGYVLGLWGLPLPVVEAIAHHHQPTRTESGHFDLSCAVHVAARLAEEHIATSGLSAEPLDVAYLTKLGVMDKLPAWRQMAKDKAAGL
jgi:HD-like signal output (HDOD) protein